MRGFFGLVVLAELSGGCASQSPRALHPASFDTSELVPYGALTRADFKGTMSTGFTRGDEERVAATGCVTIVVRPPGVVTRAVATGYVATLDDPIFFSVLSRNCSWWSENEALSAEQVLEHEQIHFAIDELEARRLNARVEDVQRRIYSAGPDLGVVSQRAQGELRAILEAARKHSLERSTVFDHQVARDRVRQRAWFHKIMAELDATRAYARGPQASPIVAVAIEPVVPLAPVPVPVRASSSAQAPAGPASTAPSAPAPATPVVSPRLPPISTPPAQTDAPPSTGAFPD